MPYLGIENELKLNANPNNINFSSYANHWYGDYSIPNDAKFYYKEGKTGKDIEVPKDGFIVAYFSIKTKKSDNSDYLAYNLESPFVQTKAISQWEYERQDNKLSNVADQKFTLPKTNIKDKEGKKTSDYWMMNGTTKADGSTAVIIYSLNPTASTKQNVTSAGTH